MGGKLLKSALAAAAVLLVAGAVGCAGDDDDAAAQSQAAIGRYQDYLVKSSTTLAKEVETLVAELEAGDRAGARSRYASARRSYGQVKPLSMLFEGLDRSIDNRPAYNIKGDLTGFHRVERTLWTNTPPASGVSYARKLREHVEELRARLSTVDLEPEKIVNGIHLTADKIYSIGLNGVEEPYSGIELVDDAANVEGMRAAFKAVEPELGTGSKLSNQIDGRLNALEARMDKLRTPAGFPKLEQLAFIEIVRISHLLDALKPLLSDARKQLENQEP